MAYIPSECSIEEYENQIYSGDSDHQLYIKHGETILADASPFASGLKWKRRILANGNSSFKLDNFVSQEIELVLHDYEITNLNEELEIKVGTYIDSVGSHVFIPLGIYKIQDKPTTDKNKITYKLRDRSVNFDFGYNAKPLIDNSTKEDEDGNKYVTKLEILLDICQQANVEYIGTQTFIGYDDRVAIYDNTINGRIYVAYLFEQAGMMCFLNRNGQLDSINIKNLTTKEIDSELLESFTIGDDYEISKVVYESGSIKWETGTDTKDSLFINGANPYITKQEDIDRLSNLIGFKINSFKTGKIIGNPLIDPYDLVKFTYEDNEYITLAQYDLNFSGVMTTTFDTTIKHDAKQSNVTKNNDATYKKSVRTEIDNINGSISTIVTDMETTYDGLEGRVSEVETKQTSTDYQINILSTNIDEDGNITGVKTTTGYTFDKDGLKIGKKDDQDSPFNSLQNNTGTYYKDGDTIISQFTKDNIIIKDLVLYGRYYYGVEPTLDVAEFKKDDAMFVSELYTDAEGEEGFGHFYNRGD